MRRKFYNELEDLKGKIRVFCRVRPLSGSEKERGCQEAVKCADECVTVRLLCCHCHLLLLVVVVVMVVVVAL